MKNLLISLWFLSFSVGAAGFNDGLEAYNRQDYRQAYAIWEKLINSQSRNSDGLTLETMNIQEKSFAQYAIGLMFWQGQGVKQSYAEAFRWLSQAAENGHKEAALKLAVLYVEGLAGLKNPYKGAEWMAVAARAGLADAQYNLGLMYLNGNGLSKDKEQAVYWLLKADAAGIDEAGKLLKTLLDEQLETSESKLSSANAHNKTDIAAEKVEGATVHPPLLAAVDSEHAPEKPKEASSDEGPQVTPPSQAAGSAQLKDNLLPYAVQVAATPDIKLAEKMVEQYAETAKLKLFRKRVKQQDWYVLLDCCFSTRAEAKQSLSALPSELSAKKPFIISTSLVSPMK